MSARSGHVKVVNLLIEAKGDVNKATVRERMCVSVCVNLLMKANGDGNTQTHTHTHKARGGKRQRDAAAQGSVERARSGGGEADGGAVRRA
eukprot:448906-Rhodomonas_salina.1